MPIMVKVGADRSPLGGSTCRSLWSTVRDLQGTVGAGRGFIVDEHGNIIAHSNPDRIMQPWRPRDGEVRDLGDRLDEADLGEGYEGIGYNGTRQLVYYREGPDHPWTIVIIVPMSGCFPWRLKSRSRWRLLGRAV